jgi:hypothetical protein
MSARKIRAAKLVVRVADDFAWADEMTHDQVKTAKEIAAAEGKTEGTLIYKWNHKALRHYRPENEMQLRQQQREERAMEIQDAVIETQQQQQKHKNKKYKKKKKITRPNHTTEWLDPRMASVNHAIRRNGRT